MAKTSLEFRVGFRFHPTKEELVNHYLRKKILGHDDLNDGIREIDICSCEPWHLPGVSESDDDEWFYFSRPNYKPKGKNRNRATKGGFWKITSREKVIKARRSKAVIGKKRTLTFYEGRVRSGQKTNWVMHEYYIPETLLPNTATQRDFVLCHLKKKDESTDSGAGHEVEPRTNDASDIGNPLALVHGAGGPEEKHSIEDQDIKVQQGQRDFVLCRLKRKDESTDDGACNEGDVYQTSNNNASDFQNLMAHFGRPTIPEENTRPDFAALFSFNESPQSPDYFETILRGFLPANVGSGGHFELQGADDLEESDYSLEDRSRTTLFNHSSEPKSLHNDFNVYHQSIHRQADQSSQNESGRRKGDMVTSGGAEMKSGPDELMVGTAHGFGVRRGFKRRDVEYTSKAPEKPERPCRNEHKSVKQKQTGTTVGDWKSSFIVWKESPLSLRSYPPVVYAWIMIGGLILFIFMFGLALSTRFACVKHT